MARELQSGRYQWSHELPRDLLLDVFSRLPLDAVPALARTCAAWSSLAAEAFAPWLRWRMHAAIPRELPAARRVLILEDAAMEHDDDHPTTHSTIEPPPVVRVARANGCLDWADAAGSALVVCCAEPAGRDVFTARISHAALIGGSAWGARSTPSPAAMAERGAAAAGGPAVRWLRRRWPFSTLVGGLAGGMVGHGSLRTAFFPPRTDEVVAVDAVYQNILSAARTRCGRAGSTATRSRSSRPTWRTTRGCCASTSSKSRTWRMRSSCAASSRRCCGWAW